MVRLVAADVREKGGFNKGAMPPLLLERSRSADQSYVGAPDDVRWHDAGQFIRKTLSTFFVSFWSFERQKRQKRQKKY
jgi:hypothetical protein